MSSRLTINQQGQSLIEAVIVVAVGVVVMGSLVFATIASLRNAQFAKNQALATKLAQEGIEAVRSGRNRNAGITGLNIGTTSWDSDTLWNNRINSSCLDPCYFKLLSGRQLQFLQAAQSTLPDSSKIDSSSIFKRVIQLSDDPSSYTTEKRITSIVTWDDVTGTHQSKLVTILVRSQ